MGRPSLITEEMEDFIKLELAGKPRPTADAIYKALVKKFESDNKPFPGDDAIIKRITKLRKEMSDYIPSELDRPFTIGDCMNYQIPLTSALLELYKLTANAPIETRFTIRQVRWFALLYPLLSPIIEAKLPTKSLGYTFFIAKQYARLQQICFITGLYMNTLPLDTDFFINENYSFETVFLAGLEMDMLTTKVIKEGGK